MIWHFVTARLPKGAGYQYGSLCGKLFDEEPVSRPPPNARLCKRCLAQLAAVNTAAGVGEDGAG